jgi:hypothetical protein
MNREAHLILLRLLTTINASPYRARASRPSAPLRNGTILLMAKSPLPGKEGNVNARWATVALPRLKKDALRAPLLCKAHLK